EVNEAEVSDLNIENEEDAIVSVIITMPSDPQKMTANLKAPMIFNLKNRKGRQIILNNTEYTTRHNIMEEMRKHTLSGEQQSLQGIIDQAREQKGAAVLAKAEKK
ncbi:MAG: flagellar assembly protein FliW, partial [Proteobacteria bacterium]|nr:flagellar assembly protein FliW [Pseudomonadota bacterium]